MTFETRSIAATPDAIAPDGSEVRVLGMLSRGGMAAFRLAPNTVSKAVAHRTVEEVWYFIAGCGRIGASSATTRKSPRSFLGSRSRSRPVRNSNSAATEASRSK